MAYVHYCLKFVEFKPSASDMVKWLGYLALTQVAQVQFPVSEIILIVYAKKNNFKALNIS